MTNLKYKKAIKYFNKAISINPERSQFYYRKGGAQSALKRYKKAIVCYDKAIQLNLDSEYLADAHFKRS